MSVKVASPSQMPTPGVRWLAHSSQAPGFLPNHDDDGDGDGDSVSEAGL